MTLSLKEMMLFMLISVTMTLYWITNSLIIQLIMLIGYIILNSVMIYMVSNMSMISYLMLFSVISGLIVVLCFVFMTESNTESSLVSNKSELMILIPSSLCFSLIPPLEILMGWSNQLFNQFSFFSNFLSDLYLIMFMFMVFVLLMMLYVIDFIILSQGGSMLPMK